MAVKNIYRILSVPAYGAMYLFTAIMLFIGIPFIFFNRKQIVKAMMRFWARVIFLILGKTIRVEGKENIPHNLHYMLVANHSSLFDIVAIASVFPDIAWFGHERLMKVPVFRRFLILTGYIPMRKTSYRNTKEMIDNLKEGSKTSNIAIFPEGTRSLDGKINDFYRGFIILLRSSDIAVLPVTLNGFYSLKPKNRFSINFSAKPEVIIHKHFDRSSLVEKSDQEIAALIKFTIESSVKNDPDELFREINFDNPNKILA
jgi:1-acyl-sn-glycerol-3-phosphate acyltransferase